MRVEEVDTEGGDMVAIDSCPSEGCTDFGTSEHIFFAMVGGSLHQSKPQAENPFLMFCF